MGKKSREEKGRQETCSGTAHLPVLQTPYRTEAQPEAPRGFQRAYEANGHRMSAPFLTQLAIQYDAMDVLAKDRQERRKLAKQTYAPKRPRRRSGFWPPVSRKRHDIKV